MRNSIFSALLIGSMAVSVSATALADDIEVEAVVGEAAPDFTLTDETGQSHTLSEYQGQIVVLEWTNPQCPFVVRHYQADTMETLEQEYGANVQFFAVNSSHFNTPEDSATWKEAEGFGYPTLQDNGGAVGYRYGARTTPHMYVIAPDGTLAYAGAIDDDPRGNSDAPTNYVASAIDSIMAGEEPNPSSTEPYGCTVKYE